MTRKEAKKPKYVAWYFPERENVTRADIKKRYKVLDNLRFGYKTKEYRDLGRYLRVISYM